MHFVDACPAIDFNASEPRYCCRLGPALTKGVSALPLRLRETPQQNRRRIQQWKLSCPVAHGRWERDKNLRSCISWLQRTFLKGGVHISAMSLAAQRYYALPELAGLVST